MLHEALKNYLDAVEQAVLGCDCTPHFPDLASFPHHEHLPGSYRFRKIGNRDCVAGSNSASGRIIP